MTRYLERLLLISIPGLMFCVISIPGMEFRLSWQLVAIWAGGLAFAALLSSWLRQAFWLICVVVTTRYLPPAYDAYIAMLMIAIFLAAVEGFKRMEREHVHLAMRIAAAVLLVWIALQDAGSAISWFPGQNAGPFNPNTGGIYLALCLPAFMAGWWWLAVPVIIGGIFGTQTSTAIIAAAAGASAFGLIHLVQIAREGNIGKFSTYTSIVLGVLVLAFVLTSWANRIETPASVANDIRWTAWKHAAWSLRSESLGRGLGSWQAIFPILASGDRSLGVVENKGNEITGINVFAQAHNEYVQVAFEAGLPALAIVLAFLALVAMSICFGIASAQTAAGVVILAVACFGSFPLHVAPTALLGAAWIGLWEKDCPCNLGSRRLMR